MLSLAFNCQACNSAAARLSVQIAILGMAATRMGRHTVGRQCSTRCTEQERQLPGANSATVELVALCESRRRLCTRFVGPLTGLRRDLVFDVVPSVAAWR